MAPAGLRETRYLLTCDCGYEVIDGFPLFHTCEACKERDEIERENAELDEAWAEYFEELDRLAGAVQ